MKETNSFASNDLGATKVNIENILRALETLEDDFKWQQGTIEGLLNSERELQDAFDEYIEEGQKIQKTWNLVWKQPNHKST
eukprot:UN13551